MACSASRPISVQTNSSDVLYIGINNPVIIKGEHMPRALISIDNGTFRELNELSNDTMKFLEVNVSNTMPTAIKIDDGKRIIALKYRNKKIPDPVVLISVDSARIGSGSVSPEKFRTATGLVCNISGFDYNIAMKIISFKMTIIRHNKASTTTLVQGNTIKNHVRTADSADVFIFHDVLMEFMGTKEQRLLSGPTIFVD